MSKLTYFQLIHQAIDLYNDGNLQEAYDLLDENGDDAGGNRAQILNFKYCIASRLGKTDLAMQLFRDSIVGTEYWYGYDYLYQDDDLKGIRDLKEFGELANICREREKKAKMGARPELKVMMPEKPNGHWLIALHGNGDSVSLTEGNWHHLVSKNYSLAFPQSSQIISYDNYTWQDLSSGMVELKGHIKNLEEDWNMGQDDFVLCGFSGGARLSLYAVLFGGFHPKGLILIAPWLPELKEWQNGFKQLAGTGLKVCIICGDKDGDSFESSNEMISQLERDGVAAKSQIVKDLGHDFPNDFATRLDDMLRFIDW